MNKKMKVARMEVGPKKVKHGPILIERYVVFNIIDQEFKKELLEKFAPEIDDPDANVNLEFETCIMKNMSTGPYHSRNGMNKEMYHRTKMTIGYRQFIPSTNPRAENLLFDEDIRRGQFSHVAPGVSYKSMGLYLSDEDIEFFKADIYEATTDYIFNSSIEIKS